MQTKIHRTCKMCHADDVVNANIVALSASVMDYTLYSTVRPSTHITQPHSTWQFSPSILLASYICNSRVIMGCRHISFYVYVYSWLYFSLFLFCTRNCSGALVIFLTHLLSTPSHSEWVASTDRRLPKDSYRLVGGATHFSTLPYASTHKKKWENCSIHKFHNMRAFDWRFGFVRVKFSWTDPNGWNAQMVFSLPFPFIYFIFTKFQHCECKKALKQFFIS